MFDALTDKLGSVFRSLSGRGRISEENVREAMVQIRRALVDADVNYGVAKDFTESVLEKAIGQEVIKTLRPDQLIVRIVYEELVKMMGPVDTQIYFVSPGPTVIMMCGLQGSGKTTTCGKLARYLVSKGRRPMLAAADLQRPAAMEQLIQVGKDAGVPVYSDPSKVAPHGQVPKGAAVAVCRAAIQQAKADGRDVVILDTAGRLHIDEELMGELKEINNQLRPHQIYFVLDAMTGQNAIESADAFNKLLELDGLILTKLDSDTRGGALLTAKVITGKPVKFMGTGEKLDALEEFRPEGMAQRILGMGDMLALVTKAQEVFDQEEAEKLQAKMEKGQFTLDDFMSQMGQVKKLGSMGKVLGMIPGMGQMIKQMNMNEGDVEKQMRQMHAIYNSMNKVERKNPDVLDGNRRRRIARGAGVDTAVVGQFIKQFNMSRDMMKAVGGMGTRGKIGLMKHLMSGDLAGLGMPSGPMIKTKKSGFMEKKDRNKKKKRR